LFSIHNEELMMKILCFTPIILLSFVDITWAQLFNGVDSINFALPFDDADPYIDVYNKGDTLYLLNHTAGIFYTIDNTGSICNKVSFQKILDQKLSFWPITVHVSSNYYLFSDGARFLLLDKSLKLYGFYWFQDTVHSYRSNTRWLPNSLFFNEKNHRIYFSTVTDYRDTDNHYLTSKYYLTPIIASFNVPSHRIKDSASVLRIYSGKYLIARSPPYKYKYKFLPHLDFRNLYFDEKMNNIIISEAADSLVYIYDIEGHLVSSFGKESNNIKVEDSVRFIFIIQDRYKNIRGAFSWYLDSLFYTGVCYTAIKYFDSLDVFVRENIEPDTLKFISGNIANYNEYYLMSGSKIIRSNYLQIYLHKQLAADFRIPQKWKFIGIAKGNLLFYALKKSRESDGYKVVIYFVPINKFIGK